MEECVRNMHFILIWRQRPLHWLISDPHSRLHCWVESETFSPHLNAAIDEIKEQSSLSFNKTNCEMFHLTTETTIQWILHWMAFAKPRSLIKRLDQCSVGAPQTPGIKDPNLYHPFLNLYQEATNYSTQLYIWMGSRRITAHTSHLSHL